MFHESGLFCAKSIIIGTVIFQRLVCLCFTGCMYSYHNTVYRVGHFAIKLEILRFF